MLFPQPAELFEAFVIIMSDIVDNEYKDGHKDEYKDNSVKIKKMVFTALFAALIAVGAYLRIPLPFGVPITLQTFFVLLAAVTLGKNWGTVCIIVYLLVGFIGFPVFAGGNSGLGILFGPTGGYLYSFIIVALVIGYLSEKTEKTPMALFLIALFGSLLILGSGTIHLAFFAKIPLHIAFMTGFVPFIMGDFVKSIAIALIAATVYKKVNFKSVS